MRIIYAECFRVSIYPEEETSGHSPGEHIYNEQTSSQKREVGLVELEARCLQDLSSDKGKQKEYGDPGKRVNRASESC